MNERPPERAVLWKAPREGTEQLKTAAGVLVVGAMITILMAVSLQAAFAVIVSALMTAVMTGAFAIGGSRAITEVELDGPFIRFHAMGGDRTKAVVQLRAVHLRHYRGHSPETVIRFAFDDTAIEVSGRPDPGAEKRLSQALPVPVTSETTHRRYRESGGAGP
ncbi:hypothetical protein [Planobispora rosea]|uniref:hypothetical protein n=1 Tax=Planobispora rosea TaxID=35762 RepID=UPI00083A245F|nr:hypothetical protein [Planobispora rosea]